MSEINELQARMADALSRIDTALANHRPQPDNSNLIDALKEQLEEERVVTAQLEERIKALHEKEQQLIEEHASEISALRSELEDARAVAENATAMRDEIDAILADLKPQLAEGPHA